MSSEISIEAAGNLEALRPAPLWHNDGTEPFDYEAAFARLDGAPPLPSDEGERAAETLLRFAGWLARDASGALDTDVRRIGLKAIAAATALKIYESGDGMSGREVARRLKIPNSSLNDLVSEFYAQFKVRRRTGNTQIPQQIRPELN